MSLTPEIPDGWLLVKCGDCPRQVMVRDDEVQEKCTCGAYLPKW